MDNPPSEGFLFESQREEPQQDQQAQIDESQLEYEVNLAKSLLSKLSEYNNENVFDHLCDIIKRAKTLPDDEITNFFEEYSEEIRDMRFRPLKDSHNSYPPSSDTNYSTDLTVLYKNYYLNRRQHDLDDLLPSTFPTGRIDSSITNYFMYLQCGWEKCGIAPPPPKRNLILLLLDHVSSCLPIKNVRFWGEFQNLKGCYYIFEADSIYNVENMATGDVANSNGVPLNEIVSKTILERLEFYDWTGYDGVELRKFRRNIQPLADLKIPRPREDPEIEKIVKDTNRHVYCVCTSTNLQEPLLLNNATGSLIKACLELTYMLTGDLDVDIVSYPRFSGTEHEYLRSLIAIITAFSNVHPKNYKKPIGDIAIDTFKNTEQHVVFDARKYLNIDKWNHVEPSILGSEKTNFDDHQLENDDESEGSRDDEGEDETGFNSERSSIGTSENLRVLLSEELWNIRLRSEFCGEAVIATSLLYPGAFVVVDGPFHSFIYMGWGSRQEDICFNPKLPPQVENQTEELIEIREPTLMEERDFDTTDDEVSIDNGLKDQQQEKSEIEIYNISYPNEENNINVDD